MSFTRTAIKTSSAFCFITFFLVSLSFTANGKCFDKKENQNSDTVVITSQKIKTLNVNSIQDLFNLVSGVKAGESSISIRGSYSVKVLLDGLVLNDPNSVSVKFDLVPFHQIKSIKIIKGAGSAAYGDDSSGGVVLITTKKINLTKAYAEVSSGNYQTGNIKANLSHKWDQWGIAFNGEFKTRDEYRPNNDKEEKRAGFKISYQPENWGKGMIPTFAFDFGEKISGSAGYPQSPTLYARLQDQSLGSSLNFGKWGIKSGTYFTRFRSHRVDSGKSSDTSITTWSVKQNLVKSVVIPFLGKTTLGGMAKNTHGQGSGISPTDEQTYSMYALKALELKSLPLTLNFGLRTNLYSEFDSEINPEISAVYTWGFLSFNAGYSKTNNLPTMRKRYYSHPMLKANPDLGMEISQNYNFGISYSAGKFFSADISLFNNEIKNRITYVRDNNYIGQYQNIGKAHLRGVDASFSLTPVNWLKISPSYTYLEAKDEATDLCLTAKPKHKIKADLLIRPNSDYMLGLNVTYSSEVFTRSDNKETAPDYILFDLRSEYLINGFRIFAKINNLFNKAYLYGDGLPGPPRMWLVGVGYNF